MINILLIAAEMAISLAQGFLLAYFCLKFLTPKKDVDVEAYMIMSGVVQGILLTAAGHFGAFEGIIRILYWVGLFFFSCKMLNGNLVKKALGCTLPLLAVFLVYAVGVNCIAMLNSMSVAQVVRFQGGPRVAAMFLGLCFDFLFLRAILKMFKTDEQRFKAAEWGAVIAVMMLSLVTETVLYTISINTADNLLKVVINALILLLIEADILLFYPINTLIKKMNRLREPAELKLHRQYQSQYIEVSGMQYDSVKKMRHDMKNQFLTVYTLLKEEKTEEALSYIEKLIDRTQSSETVINTKNSIVNAIVNSKLSMASAMKISTSCFSVSSFEGIDDIDLCNLLSNSLDNAIYACQKIPENEKRIISLKITQENEIYTFLVQNSVNGSVLEENPGLLTDKGDSHGFGTKILSEIAEGYDGRCDFYEKEGMFNCKVILKGKN